MNKIKYRLIKYYINKTSFEFINIGIIAYNKDNFKVKFLDVEKIDCNYINKEILSETIDFLTHIIIDKNFNKLKLYFDDYSFTNEFIIKQLDSFDNEIEYLFYKFIDYKFSNKISKEKITKKDKIIQTTTYIIKKEFYNYIKIKKSKILDLELIINNQKKLLLFGSLSNAYDLGKAIKNIGKVDIKSPIFSSIYKIDNKNIDEKNQIEKIGYKVNDYSSNDKIKESLEKLVS